MNYQPLSEVRDTLKVNWYRSKFEPEKLRELSKRSNLQGWFQAGGHLAIFAITGGLAYFFWSQENWLGFFIALFAHGTIGSFFAGTAPHELGHGSVFSTKWLNKAFLYLFSLLSWWNPFDYAGSHTYHHRYTLHPEGDRENLLPLHPSVDKTFLVQMFTLNLFTQPGRTFGKGGLISTVWVTFLAAFGKVGSDMIPSNEWLKALHTDQPAQHQKSVWWSRALLLFHGSVLVISFLTGLWVLPLIFSLFPFIANWLSYFVALPQHCGLRENTTDFRTNSRSLTLNPLVEFLYWHMNWHTEHHMYAGIPCYNLKNLHRELAHDMPAPRTLWGAWQEMLEIWRQQQTDPGYQFDTPLPPTAKLVRSGTTNVLESSIGELAPKGLK